MFPQNGARWFSLNVRVPPTWSLEVMLMTTYCTRANTLLYGVRGLMGKFKHPHTLLSFIVASSTNVLPMGRGGFLSTLECPPLLVWQVMRTTCRPSVHAMQCFFPYVEGAPLSVLLMHPFEPSSSARLWRRPL
jgi:hypothetical protein